MMLYRAGIAYMCQFFCDIDSKSALLSIIISVVEGVSQCILIILHRNIFSDNLHHF